jgi:hypothetical protein
VQWPEEQETAKVGLVKAIKLREITLIVKSFKVIFFIFL